MRLFSYLFLAFFLCVDFAAASAVTVPFVKNEAGYAAKSFAGTLIATENGEIVHRLYAAEGSVVLVEKIGFSKIEPSGQQKTEIRRVGSSEVLYPYESLELGAIADKISLRLVAKKGNVEKLFTLGVGGKISKLRIKIAGATKLAVDREGRLIATSEKGSVAFTKPFAFQTIAGATKPVAVRYRVTGKSYGFSLGAYDPAHEVVIDPLIAATYTGGAAYDETNAIAIDPSNGMVYVGGSTDSDSPSIAKSTGTGAVYDTSYASQRDGFIAKYDENLTELKALTYVGGSGVDHINALAIDSAHNVYAVGDTTSSDIATTAALVGSSYGGNTDGFLLKLDADLKCSINCVRFVGGGGGDMANSVATDGTSVFVGGYTASASFTGMTTASPHNNNYDGFVAKYAALNLAPAAGTNNLAFIGGADDDRFNAIKLYSPNAGTSWLYAAGWSDGGWAPTCTYNTPAIPDVLPICPTPPTTVATGNRSALVAWFNASDLSGPTTAILAGDGNDEVYTIEAGFSPIFDNVVAIGGSSNSPRIVYESSGHGGKEMFVAVLPYNLAAVPIVHFGGGDEDDSITSIVFDDQNHSIVYVGGTTKSTNMAEGFPALSAGAFSSSIGGDTDGFLAKIDTTLKNSSGAPRPDITDMSYLGGSGADRISQIVSYKSTIFAVGTTTSNDINLSQVNDPARKVGADSEGFAIRISGDLKLDTPVIAIDPASSTFTQTAVGGTSAAQTVVIRNNGYAELKISAITPSSYSHFTIDPNGTDGCGSLTAIIVPPMSNCKLAVSFVPTVTGTHTLVLVVASNDPINSSLTASFSATAGLITGYKLKPYFDDNTSRISYDFGDTPVATTKTATLTVKNWGSGTLKITDIVPTDGNFSLDYAVANPCNSSGEFDLASDANCTIGVKFTPTDEHNFTTAKIRITSNDTPPVTEVSVKGVGKHGLSITPNSLWFGMLPLSSPAIEKNITITNNYADAATLSFPAALIGGGFTKTLDNCSYIASGADCNITIEFDPLTIGAASGVLSFSDSVGIGGGHTPDFNISLSGIATSPLYGVIDITVNDIPVTISTTAGAETNTTLQVRNSGGAALTINDLDLTNPTYFEIELAGNTCVSTNPIASGVVCKFNVKFKPTTVGTFETNITVKSPDPNTADANISLIGVANAATPLAVSYTTSLKGKTATFTATPSGGKEGYGYLWSFGDSTPDSPYQNPTHAYTNSGDYNVTLKVTDSGGGVITKIIEIKVVDGMGITLDSDKHGGSAPLAVHFTAAVTGGVTPYAVKIDYKDGTEIETFSAAQGNFTFDHTFEHAGAFESIVTVTSAGVSIASPILTLVSLPSYTEDVYTSGDRRLPEDEGHCFIATAAYGSYLSPQVRVLREFRDSVLMQSGAGRWFVATYYKLSPRVADIIGANETLRGAVRILLTPIVYAIKFPLIFAALLLMATLPFLVRLTRRLAASPRLTFNDR